MYGFSTTLTCPFTDAVARVREALKQEGFGVVTEIDVQRVAKEKLGVEQGGYLILGACNPKLAHQAIEHDADIGLLLPCNVLVREDPAGIVVAFMDPVPVLGLAEQEALNSFASQVRVLLVRVRDALAA